MRASEFNKKFQIGDKIQEKDWRKESYVEILHMGGVGDNFWRICDEGIYERNSKEQGNNWVFFNPPTLKFDWDACEMWGEGKFSGDTILFKKRFKNEYTKIVPNGELRNIISSRTINESFIPCLPPENVSSYSISPRYS